MALQGKDLRKLVVREVMSKPLPQVPRTAQSSVSLISLATKTPRCSWKWANARFEILTKYDLMSTVASLMDSKR